MIVVETASTASSLWGSHGEEKQVSMVRRIVAVCCLVSVWGCARPIVQPDSRSAQPSPCERLKEMSQGLRSYVSLWGRLSRERLYRIFAADFFLIMPT